MFKKEKSYLDWYHPTTSPCRLTYHPTTGPTTSQCKLTEISMD